MQNNLNKCLRKSIKNNFNTAIRKNMLNEDKALQKKLKRLLTTIKNRIILLKE